MGAMASKITSLTIVYSIVYSGADQRKTPKLRVTGLCVGNSLVTGEFPAQRASNAENVSIWWRHHGTMASYHFTVVVVLQRKFHNDWIIGIYTCSTDRRSFIHSECHKITTKFCCVLHFNVYSCDVFANGIHNKTWTMCIILRMYSIC